MSRSARNLPLCAALLLVVATRALAQSAADAPSASVVGVACVDLDENGACGARDLPLPDADVRLSNGLSSRTDAAGRFHLAAAGAERTTQLGSSLLPRPESVALFIDAPSLGPTARKPAPIQLALTPGAVVPVVVPVRLPERAAAPLPRLAGAPTVRIDDARWTAELPLALAPGHELSVDGIDVAVDAAGSALVPVALGAREAVLHLADRAPDGRVTLARLRVLRVPRLEGGVLVVSAPLEVLARLDLPPRARATAPGALLVPVQAAPGTEIRVGDARAVVDDSGQAFLAARAAPSIKVHARRDDVALHATLPITVDPLAALTARVAGELRAGAVGLTPFAQGRLDAALHAPVGDSTFAVGASLDDELAGAALAGRLRLQPSRALLAPRAGDAETDLAVWGDASRTTHDNPAELALWARAHGPWGEAGLGPARTPLDEGEVGRFDRAVVGPFADAAVDLAGVRLGVEAAGDASSVPFVDAAYWRKAHDEIEASGGRVYWLAHRFLAPGSERVALELTDPLTGMVLERRILLAGADYQIDRSSGRVLLAAPLGLAGGVGGTRPGEFATGWKSRLVVDYAHASSVDEATSHDGAARVYVEAGERVRAGLRAAATQGGDASATLLGFDVSAQPTSWIGLSASAAHSAGDPFAAAGLARSSDAGLSYRTHAATDADLAGGDAVALRARVGGARSFAAAWGAFRTPGFADGASADSIGASRVGAEGRLELFEMLSAGALVDARSGADPFAGATEDVRLSSIDTSARLEGRLGIFRLALDGLHRRAERVDGADVQAGDASAAGLELGVALAPGVELFGGHLQRVLGGGEGPGAADPTLSYVGALVPMGERARLEGRVGVHPDLRPEAALQASFDEGSGVSRYGAVAVTSDAPWSGRGTTVVSGARESLGPDVEVYAEDRVARSSFDESTPWQSARVVGARVRPGPLFAGLSMESGTPASGAAGAWRGALAADAGVSLRSAMLLAFGEIAGDDATGQPAARHFALGASGQARPFDDVTLGARAFVARGAPLDGSPERPFAELFVGGAWRPQGLPDVFAHYSLREDRRLDQMVERMHLARAAVGIGSLPSAQVLLSTQLAQHELAERAEELGVSQAVLGSARLTVPVWLVEPALELGARAVFGGGLETALGGTARIEAALRLGPAALGAGVVLIGYTGTGLEELALDPAAPPVYLVVRGALE